MSNPTPVEQSDGINSSVLPVLRFSVEAAVDGRRVVFGDAPLEPGEVTVDGYRLRCSRSATWDLSLTRADGKKISVDHLLIDVVLPLLNFHQIVVPDCGRNFPEWIHPLNVWGKTYQVSAPNNGHPLMILIDQSGAAAASVGIVGPPREITVTCVEPGKSRKRATMVAFTGELRLQFQVPTEGFKYSDADMDEVRESIYLGKPERSWFHALRGYTDLCKERFGVKYTVEDDAYRPIWCSWTAWYSAHLDQELVLKNAREAKELGIGSIIIDDGWFGPGLDVDDQTLTIGDYRPDPVRFPDLPGLVKSLKELGLKSLLWSAPHACAPESQFRKTAGDMLIHCGGELYLTRNGFHCLCPCNPKARRYICSELVRMVREYGVDGFKHDLYNCLPAVPCDAPHEHDTSSMIEGLDTLMREVWETLRGELPGGILELKQNYGNVFSAQYGSMVRAGDTPYDVDLNLLRCYYPQAYAGTVLNDYLAWSKHESPEDLGRMLVKMIAAGVPAFSVDLLAIPDSHRHVIKSWLGYYNARVALWKQPREPQDAALDVWQIDAAEHLWIAVTGGHGPIVLKQRPLITIANAGASEGLLVKSAAPFRGAARFQDCYGAVVREEEIQIGNIAAINVPLGGRVEIGDR